MTNVQVIELLLAILCARPVFALMIPRAPRMPSAPDAPGGADAAAAPAKN